MTDTAVAASAWALGSQVWTGTIDILIAKKAKE